MKRRCRRWIQDATNTVSRERCSQRWREALRPVLGRYCESFCRGGHCEDLPSERRPVRDQAPAGHCVRGPPKGCKCLDWTFRRRKNHARAPVRTSFALSLCGAIMNRLGTGFSALVAAHLLGVVGLHMAAESVWGQLPPAKQPIPALAAQAAAEKSIKSLYKSEFAKSSVALRSHFARELIEYGSKTNDDPVVRFVYWREASDIAAQAGDPITALRAIDSLAQEYLVD